MANAEATRETTEDCLFVNRRLAFAHIKQPTRETIGDCLFVNLTKNERSVPLLISCPSSFPVRGRISRYTRIQVSRPGAID